MTLAKPRVAKRLRRVGLCALELAYLAAQTFVLRTQRRHRLFQRLVFRTQVGQLAGERAGLEPVANGLEPAHGRSPSVGVRQTYH